VKFADIDAEIEKLDVKPGDIVHVSIDRKLGYHDLHDIMQDVRQNLPEGVVLMLTTPETKVRLERAHAGDQVLQSAPRREVVREERKR
jgi:hypothetical protein